MNASGIAGRLLAGAIIVALLAGCASGASSTPAPATPTNAPSSAVATPTPTTGAATATPAATSSVVVTSDLAYAPTNPVLAPGVLDVYTPAKAGPWPVVVMFHGGVGDRGNLSEHARKVADLGFVVFVSTWGRGPGGGVGPLTYDGLLAAMSQGACAVEFARVRAAEYGGDRGTMIVFGHSAGPHAAAMATFARPEPLAGCLGSSVVGEVDALVTLEGLWLLPTIPPGRVGQREAVGRRLLRAGDQDGGDYADLTVGGAFDGMARRPSPHALRSQSRGSGASTSRMVIGRSAVAGLAC